MLSDPASVYLFTIGKELLQLQNSHQLQNRVHFKSILKAVLELVIRLYIKDLCVTDIGKAFNLYGFISLEEIKLPRPVGILHFYFD